MHFLDAVLKNQKFTATTFWQKFRQSIFFTKELYYELISRKFFEVGVNFRNFHTVTRSCSKIREINSLVTSLVRTLI